VPNGAAYAQPGLWLQHLGELGAGAGIFDLTDEEKNSLVLGVAERELALRHRGKMQGHHFQVDKSPLLAIPLHVPDASSQDSIAGLVDRVIAVQERMHADTITEAEYTHLERLAMQIDSDIQEEIEQLYGLNEADKEVLARFGLGSTEAAPDEGWRKQEPAQV
jgi:hypothetical protein